MSFNSESHVHGKLTLIQSDSREDQHSEYREAILLQSAGKAVTDVHGEPASLAF